jgi:hypothetical protein
MHARAFRAVFWGLLVVAVGITVQRTRVILPAFVGYLILWAALGRLQGLQARFGQARVLAALLALVSLPLTVKLDPLGLLSVAATVLHVALVWQICTGVAEAAADRGRVLLADDARSRRGLFMLSQAAFLAFLALGMVGARGVLGLALVAAIALTLIATVAVMFLMRRAGLELG